jgi:hypothetical protein
MLQFLSLGELWEHDSLLTLSPIAPYGQRNLASDRINNLTFWSELL